MTQFLTFPEGGRIFAEVDGTGESVLFVHADFLDGRMWDQVRALMAPEFRVAAYDKLGYGRSDAATGPVARRRELAAVIEALGLGRVHLVGCSNGGRVALDYTLENPGSVRSLTLVNAPPSGWEPEGAPPPLILAMLDAFQRGDRAAASEVQLQIWFDGPDRTAADLSPGLKALRAQAAVMNRICVDRGTFFVADAMPPDLLDPPAVARLAEVRVPTLVVDGRGDWSENRRASQILAQGIPGARLVTVDGAHVPSMEDPEGFVQLLKTIIR